MRRLAIFVSLAVLAGSPTLSSADDAHKPSQESPSWPQWRGPNRDGRVDGHSWPDRLTKDSLKPLWRVPLGPSYSGPIIAKDLVFTTETKNKEIEIVHAIDPKSGKERWHAEWKGSLTVPFFAAANGSWIRSTPAYDGRRIYVAGMRDLLVCLDARSGEEKWRVDFVNNLKSPPPAFGFVSSPLVVDGFVYVQAGASLVKLKADSGEIVWRVLKDEGGMNGSAFSSPVLADLAGKRQIVVQTREKLAGVDPDSGAILWTQVVPAFRGMNILTPVVLGDGVFTSSYQNKSWLYRVSEQGGRFAVAESWSNNAAGYMSTPVVIDGHAYLHLQNQRFTCIDLKTGERTWTSQPFGKYCSLIAQGNRILALDQRGILLLIKANPKQFELIDSVRVADDETWAHLAIVGDELYVRELNALAAFRWNRDNDGR
jgi:outer membrane protein assembly factor BamB